MKYYGLIATGYLFALPLCGAEKEPPNSVDHAGIKAPLPTAPAFGKGTLKFGEDPYAMFQREVFCTGLRTPNDMGKLLTGPKMKPA